MNQNRPSYQHNHSCQTVLVMGGSGKIGRAICLEFAKNGWNVAVHYHRHSLDAEETAAQVRALGAQAICLQGDMENSSQVQATVTSCRHSWGRIDALIYSVGYSSSQLIQRTSSEQWTKTLNTNLTGVFYCLQAVGRHFLRKKTGSVIILGSLSAIQGTSGQSAYSSSKAGLIGLVKTVAQEWGPFNVRINLVFPGWHESRLVGNNVLIHQQRGTHTLGRTPGIAQVARTVYILSQLPDTSGQMFNLDSRIW